jgi:nitrogen regulatory protein PII
MHEIKAVVRADRLEAIIQALHAIPNLPGITASIVRGIGRWHGSHTPNGPEYGDMAMAKLETVVPDDMLALVISTVRVIGHTGRAGDGKIFVSDVRRAINMR